MTNAQIIFNESIALMENGVIKGTGEFAKMLVVDKDGNEEEKYMELPEAIHTFASWKSLGYIVKKGEKAKAAFTIWKKGKPSKKAIEEAEKNGEEAPEGKMFMKLAYFFTAEQVEKLA